MAVTYTKGNSNWQNNQAGGTPITEDKLDNFETGIDQVYALVTAKGDLISGTASRNIDKTAAGANDTMLIADSAQTGGIKWAKVGMGQLATGVGTNDTVLVSDSGQASGMKWINVNTAQLASNAVTNDRLATDAVTNGKVSASAAIELSKLATGAWDTYTPALTASTTSPTLGSGSGVTGKYIKQGRRTMHLRISILFGSSGVAAGSGTYFVSLPESTVVSGAMVLGHGYAYDSSAVTFYAVTAIGQTTTSLYMVEAVSHAGVTHAVPFAWAANDSIVLNLTVETTS